MHRSLITRLGALLCLALAACEHTDPFPPHTYESDPPPFPGSARLTYNPGVDWTPAWLPDGSGILYSFQRPDRVDHDRCLGLLPPGGGTLRRVMCRRVPAASESTDVYEAPAAAADGRLVYVRASSPAQVPAISPTAQALVLATMAAPESVRVLLTLPYASPSGRQHQGISGIQWAGDSGLVYLAERVIYASSCSGCPLDTVRSGREIAILSWSGDDLAVGVVPGTDQASSVTLGASSDTIYYTRNGDSRVLRRDLPSGAVDVVHDFGAGRIARDVQVGAGTLLAVVGGKVGFADVPGIGLRQDDRGGELYRVDLATGVEALVIDVFGRWFRRPRVRSAGGRLVVEAYDYRFHPIVSGEVLIRVDTIVSRVGDLWLLAVP